MYLHPLFPQVHNGARVSQDLANYWDRVWTHNANIEIRNVNYSDEGHYTLRDQRFRIVSVTRMDITGRAHSEHLETSEDWRGGQFYSDASTCLSLTADHHDYTGGNPLLGLLLLLGIPAGICCCCRKKIFKRKATTAATLQVDHHGLRILDVVACPEMDFNKYKFLCLLLPHVRLLLLQLTLMSPVVPLDQVLLITPLDNQEM